MKKIIPLVILLMLVANLSKAQEAALGDWLIYVGNKQINDKWNWEQSVQYRSYNVLDDLHQLLIRNGIGYALSDHNNIVSLGYDYLLNQQYDDNEVKSIKTNEHRMYQQFVTKQHFGRVYGQHRYRLEERFIGTDFKWRFRYLLGINICLNQRELQDHTFYLSAYNEIFLTPTGNRFDQNWLYGGIGYQLNPHLKLEGGYMNQFLANGKRDQLNIIAKLSF